MTTPAGLKWDSKMAEKATTNGTFIRVTSKPGAKGGTRQLSGAQRMWGKGENVVFLPGARLTGTREDVTQALRLAGIDQRDIDEQLANAITQENFGSSMAGLYQQELEAHKAVLSNKKATAGPVDWYKIRGLAVNLKSARAAKGEGSPGRKRGPTGPRAKTLREKYLNLPGDKQLDVSNFDGETKARQEKVPVGSSKTGLSRSSKVQSSQFPRLVSNNANTYALALRVIYGAGVNDTNVDVTSPYADAIEEVRAKLAALQVQPAPPSVGVSQFRTMQPVVPGRALSATPKPRPSVPSVASPLYTRGGGGLAPLPAFRTR